MPRVSGAQAAARLASEANAGAYVAALAWAPDGGSVAYADDDGHVGVLDADGQRRLVGEHPGGALALAWAPSPVLASGGRDGRLALDGRMLDDGGRGWIESLVWRPDGALLAAAVGRRVQFWSPDGLCRDVSEDFPATVSCLDWHPKGVLCGAGSYGGVGLLRANGAAVVQRLRWTGSVLALALSPDGRRLAHGNQDASVHFWDLRKGTELEMTGYPAKVRELAWSPDGRWLATGGGRTAALWDFHRPGGPAGSRPVELDRHRDRISGLAFQPGGELLATAGRDGLVLFWRPDSDDLPVAGAALEEPISALAWSPDGGRLAIGGSEGALAVLTVDSGAWPRSLR